MENKQTHCKERHFTARILNVGKRINVPTRASIFYTASSILARGAAFIFTPIFTRVMSQGGYGAWSLFNSYLSIISIIGSLELSGGVLYSLLSNADGETEKAQLRQNVLKISAISTLAVSSVFVLALLLSSNSDYIYLLLIPASLCRVYLSISTAVLRFKYKYTAQIIITIAEALLAPCITLLLFKLVGTDRDAFIRCAVFTAALCAIALALALYSKKTARVTDIPTKHHGSSVRRILSLALPMLPYYASMILTAQLDRALISSFIGKAAVAEYAVASALGTAPTMLLGGISASLLPWISRRSANGEWAKIRELTSKLSMPIALISPLLLCVAPELMSILAPPHYQGVLLAVYPIAAASLPLFFLTLTTAGAIGRHGGIMSLFGALAVALSLLLNITLIPHIGVVSCGIVLYISYTFLLILSNIKIYKNHQSTAINVNNYLVFSLISLIFSFLLYILRSNFTLRIIFFILIISILLIKLRDYKRLVCEN